MNVQSQLIDDSLDSLNAYFDKIYLLTIERNFDRVASCYENLKGIDFTIFTGTDGEQLNLAEMEARGQYDSHLMKNNSGDDVFKYLGLSSYNDPIPNMVACSLSHKMIHIDITNNKYQRALILEDDAILLRENIILFSEIINQLPKDWDVFYLGYLWKYDKSFLEGLKRKYVYPLLHSTGLRKYNPSLIKYGFSQPYSKNILRAGTHGGTHAYAISGRGAEIMVECQSPIQNNPDLAFWKPIMQKNLSAYVAKPKLFGTTGTPSTIF